MLFLTFDSLLKSYVHGHQRRLKDGRVVEVTGYSDRRMKRGADAGTGDLFGAEAAPAAPKPKRELPDNARVLFLKEKPQAEVPQADLFAADDTPHITPPPKDMPPVPPAPKPEGEPDLDSYDKVIVAFSGGKDSIAALLHLIERGVPKDKIELHHHDIDGGGRTMMDWPITRSYCKAIGQALGIPVYFSYREGGFEREMLRDNSETAAVVFEKPDGTLGRAGGNSGKLGTRKKFPQVGADLKTRWCSGALKVDVMAAAIRNQERFDKVKTLVVTGERAQESSNRAKYKTFEAHRTRTQSRQVDHYRPVHGWDEKAVWDIMKRHGVVPHPAYQLGWGRLSCRTCIFGSPNQWASIRHAFPGSFEHIAEHERAFGTTIHRTDTVHQRADKGKPYEALTAQPDLARLADSHAWFGPIIVHPKDWKQPAGAYAENAGPS